MTENHSHFERELGELILPKLATLSFNGVFPDFYRESGSQTQLLAFRFIDIEPLLPTEKTIQCMKIIASFVGPNSRNLLSESNAAVAPRVEDTLYSLTLCLPSDSRGLPDMFDFDEQTNVQDVASLILECLKGQAEPWWSARLKDAA